MKKQDLVLAVRWNKRKETLRKCTEDFLSFLKKLKTYQPTFFGTWYGGGSSKKEALSNKVIFEYEYIKNRFSRRDKENSYSDVGYFESIWNGEDDFKSMGIDISQGKDGIVVNWCTINLPAEGAVYDYFKEPFHQLELLKIMITHWKADSVNIHYKGDVFSPFTDEKLLKAIKENVVYYPEIS